MKKSLQTAKAADKQTNRPTEFARLQSTMRHQFETLWSNDCLPRVVVVVPSLTLDEEMGGHLPDLIHYEERLLCLLMLLRQPRTRLIYVTSLPVDPAIVDYYLHLLPGVPGNHARERLTLLHCQDASRQSLTAKILARPRLQERIRQAIPTGVPAHLTCYNVTSIEAQLSVALGLPLYGCDPDLLWLGSKSGSRHMFRQAGVPMPAGFEDLSTEEDLALAIAAMKYESPDLKRVVVKLNEGFSGMGNAVFSLEGAPPDDLAGWVREQLPRRLRFVDHCMTYPAFIAHLAEGRGIVEAFVEGNVKKSPSVQCRIDPLGHITVISTHDQVLDAETGQEYLGCQFPAHEDYNRELAVMGRRVAGQLRSRGVLGRFAVDFISVRQPDGRWGHHAIEINLRKGGTTHPFLMLQFLTGGHYDPENGQYTIPNGQQRFYFAMDDLVRPEYKGLTPPDLMDILVLHGLHFDATAQEGVFFHLIGALSEFGKLGVVSIGRTPERAYELFEKTVRVLDQEAALNPSPLRQLTNQPSDSQTVFA